MRAKSISLLAAIGLAACATAPKVSFDADPGAAFGGYRDYGWGYTAAPQGVNPLVVGRVRSSIDRYLGGRGYRQVAGEADFTVAFTLGSRNRIEVSQFGGYRPFWGGWGAWGPRDIDVRNITGGTLVIDIYEARTKQPVWHGTATEQVGENSSSQEKVDRAVGAVLANFPPPAK